MLQSQLCVTHPPSSRKDNLDVRQPPPVDLLPEQLDVFVTQAALTHPEHLKVPPLAPIDVQNPARAGPDPGVERHVQNRDERQLERELMQRDGRDTEQRKVRQRWGE